MHKNIIDPGNKTITYTANLSSVVSLLPVDKPDTPCLHRGNGIVSITTTPRNGQWAYGKILRLFLLYAQTLIKEGSPWSISKTRQSIWTKPSTRSARTRE